MDPTEAPEPAPSGGVKFDQGKPRVDLIPGDALLKVAEVFTFGAEKYAPNNWRLGLDFSRVQAAMLRHYIAWSEGEEIDAEGGFHHLAAVAWGAMVLMTMQRIHPEFDDRPHWVFASTGIESAADTQYERDEKEDASRMDEFIRTHPNNVAFENVLWAIQRHRWLVSTVADPAHKAMVAEQALSMVKEDIEEAVVRSGGRSYDQMVAEAPPEVGPMLAPDESPRHHPATRPERAAQEDGSQFA